MTPPECITYTIVIDEYQRQILMQALTSLGADNRPSPPYVEGAEMRSTMAELVLLIGMIGTLPNEETTHDSI